MSAMKNKQLDAFLKEQGCDFTAQQLMENRKSAAKKAKKELADDELSAVSGGTGDKAECEDWYRGWGTWWCPDCSYYRVIGKYDYCEYEGKYFIPE